jgi:uncharacterized membrane protein
MMPAADAKVAILESQVTLLNVVTSTTDPPEFAAAARALGPSIIVGVYPTGQIDQPPPASPPNARGFGVDNPAAGPPAASASALSLSGTNSLGQPVTLGWLEPYDVNRSGLIIGQARISDARAPRYAFRRANATGTTVPLAPGLDDGNIWAESNATAVNNRGAVVGWKRLKNGSTGDQAFYWTETGGVKDITISNAKSSRALSISDTGLVAGYYDPQTGSGRHGFVFDIAAGKVTDFGPVVVPVVVPPATSWFYEFRNVSINDAGAVAATHEVGSGNEKGNQAFLLEGGKITPILPTAGFEDSFAAGISDTGWVVGFQQDKENSLEDSGFLWFGGQTFDLSALTLPQNWLGITAVYDVYSETTSDPLVQVGTIVGKGLYLETGATVAQQRAFAMQITLQVPEPRIYLMLGVGLLAIGALRMRRLTPH